MIPEAYLRPQRVAFPRPAPKTRKSLMPFPLPQKRDGGFKFALVIFLLVMLMICLSGGENVVPMGR